MEENAICPACHISVRLSDYYCFNCGENLKPKPPSTSASSQIILYLKSALVPPFGLYWAIRYLKQPDRKPKLVGLVAIAVTLIAFVYLIIITNKFIKTVNEEVNKQLNSSLYF
ncbi:MAG: hypothetical protein ACC618_04710 [Patescibacteria group bacterium]